MASDKNPTTKLHTWYLDSRATQYVILIRNSFLSYKILCPLNIYSIEDRAHETIGQGIIQIHLRMVR